MQAIEMQFFIVVTVLGMIILLALFIALRRQSKNHKILNQMAQTQSGQFSLLNDTKKEVTAQVQTLERMVENSKITRNMSEFLFARYQAEADALKEIIEARLNEKRKEYVSQIRNTRGPSSQRYIKELIAFCNGQDRSGTTNHGFITLLISIAESIKSDGLLGIINQSSVEFEFTPVRILSFQEFMTDPTEKSQSISIEKIQGLLSLYITVIQEDVDEELEKMRQFTDIAQKSASGEDTQNEYLREFLIRYVLNRLDEFRENLTDPMIQSAIENLESRILNPLLNELNIDTIRIIPGETQCDVRDHDVLGTKPSRFPSGTIATIVRKGYRFKKPLGGTAVLQKPVVYRAE